MDPFSLISSVVAATTILSGIASAFLSLRQLYKSSSPRFRVPWRPLVLIAGILVGGLVLVGLIIIIISFTSKLPPLSVTVSPLFLAIAIAITLISITLTLIYSRRQSQRSRASNYNSRIGELTKSLTKASTEVDRILQEMAQAVRDQESIVSALKQEHARLQTEIDILKKAPEADKFFTEYMARLDKKNTKFQWVIFGIGTLIGVASIVLGFIGLHH